MDTAGLEMEEDGIRRPDDFRHEQYLLLEEEGKRILISGCSHKGIENIVKWFCPDVLVGGFHFMRLEDVQVLKEKAAALLESPTVFYTGHCTGEMQYAVLKEEMGSRLHRIQAGVTMEV